MADFSKNSTKYAEDNVSSDEENDDVLSRDESEDKELKRKAFLGKMMILHQPIFSKTSVKTLLFWAPCKQSSTPAQSLSKTSSKKKEINKKRTLESEGSDSVGKTSNIDVPKLL